MLGSGGGPKQAGSNPWSFFQYYGYNQILVASTSTDVPPSRLSSNGADRAEASKVSGNLNFPLSNLPPAFL